MLDAIRDLIRDGVNRLRDLLDPSRRLRPQPVPVPVRDDTRPRR
jgi:hypothetical protein